MKFTIRKLFRRSKREKAPKPQFDYNRDPRYASSPPEQPFASQKNGYHHHTFSGASARSTHYQNGLGAGVPSNGVFAPWLQLPTPVLQRVVTFVCPHAMDESYETCEQSAIEDACMLCDLRDLAHAGMVCKQWRKAAVPVMYHSIRIDTVHYCEREIALSEKRKRKTRFDRNGIPEDTASARLRLLCRTLRDDPTRLGKLVQYFKTPYMLRESKSSDLARTIAVLPNLKYLDLPEGVFVDDPQYHTLKLEVQARCPDLRKMTYNGGSERSLEALANGVVWTKLEVLELGRISMDPQILRHVLSAMQNLRALKVSESKVIDDDVFKHNEMLPAVPALEELVLTDTPRVTSGGLVAYLSRQDVQYRLKTISLHGTGVHTQSLQDVLAIAPRLQALSLIDEVDSPFPISSPYPSLSNFSLQTLRFEITAAPGSSPYAGITQGYYNYLANSLFSGGFPGLVSLYVRDPNFPDLLLGLPPAAPSYGGGLRPGSSGSMGPFSMGSSPSISPTSTGDYAHGGGLLPHGGVPGASNRFSSNNPFANHQRNIGAAGNSLGPPMLSLNQTLEVYTKGKDDNDWGIIKMDPYDDPGYAGGRGVGRGPRGHNRSSSTHSTGGRPLSSYGLADAGAGWREGTGGARKSIMVGNGAGGFLAVPGDQGAFGRRGSAPSNGDEWPRPRSSQGAKADRDLWR